MSTAKANHYLQVLDTARCNAAWHEIPELARKVRKHAPGRKCLALAAEVECRLQQLPAPPPNSTAPTVASYFAALSALQDQLQAELNSYSVPIPKLPSPAGGGESGVITQEDIIQTRITIAWISLLKEEWEHVLAVVPGEDEIGEGWVGEGGGKLEYFNILRMKALITQGLAQANTNSDQSIPLQLYRAAARLPATFPSAQRAYPSSVYWSEKALSHYALAAHQCWLEAHTPASPCTTTTTTSRSKKLHSADDDMVNDEEDDEEEVAEESVGVAIGRTLVDDPTVASAFRGFYSFVSRSQRDGPPPEKSKIPELEAERRAVYRNYFHFLSALLLPVSHPLHPVPKPLPLSPKAGKENTVVFSSSSSGRSVGSKAGTRDQLRAELKQVEQVYEGYLIRGLGFPRADEYHKEVGEWVDQVVENWRVAGGSGDDASPIVEILYKAATKTFHSPRILRHLFTTLTAIGNFQDAIAALSTYMELVQRAKERIMKGQEEKDHDSDKIIFRTVTEGIRVVCKFVNDGQKGMLIAATLEKWIDDWRVSDKEMLVEAYRGMGIANATWARQTKEPEQRPGAQKAALDAFRKALGLDQSDVQAWYGLALVEAEMKRIDQAMENAKKGLGALRYSYLEDTPENLEESGREYKRNSIALLQLLALLMTAKEDFAGAERVCTNAFEIIGDGRGAVRDLGLADKIAVLELKITQIAITEAVEGSEVAISRTDELLGLYSTLFDGSHLIQRLEPVSDEPAMESNPSSQPASSTKRSRFFSRSHRKQNSASYTSLPMPPGVETSPSHGATLRKRPKSGHQSLGNPADALVGDTPKIKVTDANGSAPGEKPHRKLGRPNSVSGGTIRRMKSRGSMRSSSINAGMHGDSTPPIPSSTEASSLNFGSDKESGKDPHLFHSLKHKLQQHQHHHPHSGVDGTVTGSASATSVPSDVSPVDGSSESTPMKKEDDSTSSNHNLPAGKLPLPLGASEDGLSGATRSIKRPLQLPEPKLGVEEERKKVRTALRQAWITVSGLYRRAGFVDDAEMAVREASGLVEDESTGDSDVLAERGFLMLAQGQRPPATQLFEAAIAIDVNHAQGILGLSQLLLDTSIDPQLPPSDSSRPSSRQTRTSKPETVMSKEEANEEILLDRLAASNRALGLLEKLVASPCGWDSAEAWLLLAEALEKAGEVERAKDALWQVVELEDGTGVRQWGSVGMRVI